MQSIHNPVWAESRMDGATPPGSESSKGNDLRVFKVIRTPTIEDRSLFVRKETRPLKVCAICKLPITSEQRPSVQLKNGDEVHVDCYAKREEAAHRPN